MIRRHTKSELNFWVMPNAGFATRPVLQSLVDEFEAARPDVKRGNAKIAAVADLTGCKGVHHFRGDFRQKLRGRDHGLFETAGFGQSR